MPVIQVALPVPLRQLFSYECETILAQGIRVSVPFRHRSLVGVVVESNSHEHQGVLKPIDAILDKQPILPDSIFQLAKWLSQYYHFPLGETLFTVMPAWLRSARSDDALHALISEVFYGLTEEGKVAVNTLPSSAKAQRKALTLLANDPQSRTSLRISVSQNILNTLEKKAFVYAQQRIPKAGPSWLSQLVLANRPSANRAQAAAIGVVVSQLNSFNVSLLEGVTGSGKTEVYLQAIEAVLLNGKQVLVLVPEIGLTPQTVARFEKRFGVKIAILHSQVSNQTRMRIWLQAKQGIIPLVIGTRSAVFTPFYDLGMIVVDEEHDDSFKQQDGLRYHARDVAVMRAKKHAVPLILGTATPSLESLHNALSGKYQHFRLESRAGNAQLVTQYLQDMRNHPMQAGLSEHLIEKMHQHLNAQNQVLVFLNRRGFAPALLCHQCGFVETCRQCDRPMTWHKSKHQLRCHQCDTQRGAPSRCDNCHSDQLVSEGMGTEQLENGLAQLFPNTAIARIDRDATRKKHALDETFEAIRKNQYQLLVGTQIIAKGHHFPDVTLVIIVDVDSALFSADIRATEKLAQLVTQLAGRAGREQKPGEMWLQTHNPQHPMLQDLIHNGYSDVARNMLSERQYAESVPFCVQAIVRAEAEIQEHAYNLLYSARQCINNDQVSDVIGPIQSLIEKKQGRYRMMLIVKAKKRIALHQQIHQVIQNLSKNKLAKRIRWSVDVDAIDLT